MNQNSVCNRIDPDTRPTDVLKQEHRIIERVLDAAQQILESDSINETFMLAFIDFICNFVDGCHHMKEENELYPILERAGVPRQGGCISRMLYDHELGRSLAGVMSSNLLNGANGNVDAVQSVRHAAAQYIVLLRASIQKEDNILFVMADRMLSEQDQAKLMSAFDRAQREGVRSGNHKRYTILADELYRQAFGSPLAGV